MGARERRKGAEGEREVVRRLRELGIPAERVLEQVREAGHADIASAIGSIEVKRRKSGFASLYRWLDHADMLFVRADGHAWLAVIRAEDLLWLHVRLRALGKQPEEGRDTSGPPERNTGRPAAPEGMVKDGQKKRGG